MSLKHHATTPMLHLRSATNRRSSHRYATNKVCISLDWWERGSAQNGTRLRRKSLLSSGLQLLSGGRFKNYVDMCRIIIGYEISEFLQVEIVFINIRFV
jgi:hypothetical protein